MGKGIAGAIPSIIGAASGGKGGGGSGGLTPNEQAAIQFAGQQEGMKLQNSYADMGIPNSSGLAMDLGSIPFQEAAQAGQLEQGNQAQLGNQLAALGSSLGTLSLGQGTGTTNTNPDTSQTV